MNTRYALQFVQSGYIHKPLPLAAEPKNLLQAEELPKNLQLSRKTALNYFMASHQKIAV